jgi:WD40 repeat protein
VERVATLASCEWFYHFDPAPENDPGCDWPAVERFGDFEFSDDGSLVYGGTWDRAAHVWSTATGDSVWHVEVREPWNYDWGYPMAGGVGFDNSFAFGFSWGDSGQGLNFRKAELADGAETEVMLPQPAHEIVVGSDGLLYMADLVADLVVFDPGTWTEVKRLGRGQGGSLRDVDLSPDGSLAATAGFDGFVRVWDLDADVVVQEMEVSGDIPYGLSDVEFLDETTLLVRAFAKEGIIVFTIDPENLVSTALQSITRGFTSDECATYGLEDCPTSVEAVRKTFGGSR